ncbi:MAG: AAA family ATPase [candidate division NC10 bacterium]|nr:AAA family ATPase [candidate division NC10 bacterium]
MARRRRGGARRFLRTTSIPETPLIGRGPELDRLRQAMKAAWEGRGQVVAILGEAGIGKTRLIDELAEVALRRSGQVVLGRCYETEQIFPFGPWVDLLRTAIKGHELDGFSPVWQAELGRLLPELGEPGVQAPASAEDHLRLFDAVVRLVRHLASQQPQVLMLDDLHWADEMSLRLLAFLGRRIQGAPVFIVGTSRDDELDGAPLLRRTLDEFDRDDRLVRLTLSPLDQAQTTELVRALAQPGGGTARPAGLDEQVWAASEGNPFMIVETLRALREGGETLAAGHLPMPQRVRRLISSRLERLGDRARQLAGVAAVIGREFEFGLLHRASGFDEGESAQAVEELVRRRVLDGLGERFDFVHDRIREVTYGQLLAPQRKLLHRRVAEALEDFYAGNLAPHSAALATHYREAEVWDKAASYFRCAGAEAYVRWGHREAIACFEQALAALRRLPESRETLEGVIDLRIDLHRAYHFLAETQPAVKHLRAAEALAQALGDQRRLGFVLDYLCIELQALGEHQQAVGAGERALAIAAALGDFTLEVETSNHLGQACLSLGDYRRARQLLERAVTGLESDEARERSGQPPLFAASRASLFARFPRSAHLSGARFQLIRCLYELGEFPEATARAETTVREVEASDEPNDLARTLALLGLGFVYVTQAKIATAIPILERALEVCRSGNVTLHLATAMAGLGHAYALSGRAADGLPLLEEAVALPSRANTNVPLLGLLADACLRTGQLDRAAAAATSALEAARRRKQRGYEVKMLRLLGEVARRETPPQVETAEVHYRQALALADELGMRPASALCHLALGEICDKTGRLEYARAHLSAAAELFRSMELTFGLNQAESALAELDRRADSVSSRSWGQRC